MIDFTVFEFIIFWAALFVVFFVLRPYIPAWALFAGNVVFAFYWLVRILDDGPRVSEVILLVVGVAAAFHVWWRDLRGTKRPPPEAPSPRQP